MAAPQANPGNAAAPVPDVDIVGGAIPDGPLGAGGAPAPARGDDDGEEAEIAGEDAEARPDVLINQPRAAGASQAADLDGILRH